MPDITVRDVPEATLGKLESRAAGAGQSMQEYLRRRLIEIADTPDTTDLIARISERKQRTGTELDVDTILELIDDRR